MSSVRPIYERQEDVGREAQVMSHVGGVLGLDVSKTPRLSPIDYVGKRGGNTVAAFEVKCRTNPKGKYPTYMISLKKFENLVAEARLGMRSFLVVSWTDGIQMYQVLPIDLELLEVKSGGRWDRGDSLDVEKCIFIPVDLFRPIDTFT